MSTRQATRQQTRSPKLNAPRLPGAVRRDRLAREIGSRRALPLLWVSGPPGAGKTTAISDYLENAAVFSMWYRLDAADSDPATFFHLFGQLLWTRCRARTPALPVLGPEHLADLRAFSHRYFRAVFGRIPSEAVIVFDNYDEIHAASELRPLFEALLEEVPEGVQIVIVARIPPPPHFSRAAVNGRMARLDGDDLRLDAGEAVELAAARGLHDLRIASDLHARCDGWVAGFTLLVERSKLRASMPAEIGPEGTELIFDYFDSLLFQASDERTRNVLVRTSLLPRITPALALAVTGDRHAIRVVEDLHERRLFTTRSWAGHEISYRYHGLLGEFLRSRARALLSKPERDAALAAAAAMLEEGKAYEDALALHVAREAWPAVEALLIQQAPQFIAQGRWNAFRGWVQSLPERRLADNAQLLLWFARSQVYVDATKAIPLLQSTYVAFEQGNDGIGQLLTASAALEALAYDFNDFVAMDPWIDRIQGLLAERWRLLTVEDELRVLSALLTGSIFRRPGHGSATQWAHRVVALLGMQIDVNLRAGAACVLHSYYHVIGDQQVLAAAIEARSLVSAPEVTPRMASLYWSLDAYSHYLRAEYEPALQSFDKAETLAVENELAELRVHAAILRGLCERRAGQVDAAEATIARIERMVQPRSGLRNAAFKFLRSVVEFDRGRLDSGAKLGQEALEAFVRCGQYMSILQVSLVVANMLLAGDSLAESDSILATARVLAKGEIGEKYLAAIELNEAWLAHKRGDVGQCEALLRGVLTTARAVEAPARLNWFPNALAAMLPVALGSGIEPAVARRLARNLRIVPAVRSEAWPWPVKLYTLGGFRLLVDERPPEFSRKVPRKTLLLLKALVTFGSDGVSEDRLVDLLWPDEDGDAAYAALSATVHRARVLLGDKAALKQQGGKLALDLARCWVDLDEFNRCLASGQQDAMDLALLLYRGPFLAGEEELVWSSDRRERTRVRFIDASLRVGTRLELDGSIDAAAEIYRRGLMLEEGAGALAEALARCHRLRGRHPDLVDVARRAASAAPRINRQ